MMKKVFIKEKGIIRKPYYPFWQPWGCLGCLGRTMLFILGLLLFLWLLFWLSKPAYRCDKDIPISRGDVYRPDPELIDSVLTDDTPVNFPKPVEGGDANLPDDNSNVIPPIDKDDIVTNPDDEVTQIVNNRLIVVLNSATGDETFKDFASQFKTIHPDNGYRIVYYNTLTKLIYLEIPSSERENVRQNLPKQITNLSFKIIPDKVCGETAEKIPSDPAFKYKELSWYFRPIQAYEAWGVTMGSENVVVGIVDSYFDLSHDELKGKYILPYSVERRSRNVFPQLGIEMASAGHGSHVASIAVGNANNGKGSCGIAPNCKLMPVSLGAVPTTMKILEGALYAIYQGADVINLSLGAMIPKEAQQIPLNEQIEISKKTNLVSEEMWNYIFDLAAEHNCIIVWAAGNENVVAGLDDMKRGKQTIRVSAVDKNLRKADFSNYGNFKQMDVEYSTISAPGVDILGALPGNNYDLWPGTSMAAPVITGTVALMKSINRNITPQEVIDVLQATGKPLNSDDHIGKLVQIKDALLKVKEGLLNYDDLMKNHQKIVGRWEATRLLRKVLNNEDTGETIRLYMTFNSTTQGTLEFEEVNAKNKFSAPLNVRFTQSSIEIIQSEPARCTTAKETYMIYNYVCKPDENRLLKCDASPDDGSKTISFHLRKKAK